MADDVVVLNNNLANLQSRTSKSGKQRFVVTIKSEPLVFDLSAKGLGASASSAIAESLRTKVAGIGALASAATLDYRERAAKAVKSSQRWALKRYAGGRIGAMDPNQSNRLFNDSGRFVRSIVAGATKDGWTVNLAANRLDPTTTGPGGVERMFAKLAALVPEFAKPELLLQDKGVVAGIERGVRSMVTKMEMTKEHLSEVRARLVANRNKELMNLLKDLLETIAA